MAGADRVTCTAQPSVHAQGRGIITGEAEQGEYRMPFPQQQDNPFTRERVESLSTNQLGVYGLYNDEKWIYIGSGDIRARLLAHLDGIIFV